MFVLDHLRILLRVDGRRCHLKCRFLRKLQTSDQFWDKDCERKKQNFKQVEKDILMPQEWPLIGMQKLRTSSVYKQHIKDYIHSPTEEYLCYCRMSGENVRDDHYQYVWRHVGPDAGYYELSHNRNKCKKLCCNRPYIYTCSTQVFYEH